MDESGFQVNASFDEALASPPWGTSYPKRSGVVDERGGINCTSTLRTLLSLHMHRYKQTPADSLPRREITASKHETTVTKKLATFESFYTFVYRALPEAAINFSDLTIYSSNSFFTLCK